MAQTLAQRDVAASTAAVAYAAQPLWRGLPTLPAASFPPPQSEPFPLPQRHPTPRRSALFGALLLGERLTGRAAAGAAIILAAVIVVARDAARRTKCSG